MGSMMDFIISHKQFIVYIPVFLFVVSGLWLIIDWFKGRDDHAKAEADAKARRDEEVRDYIRRLEVCNGLLENEVKALKTQLLESLRREVGHQGNIDTLNGRVKFLKKELDMDNPFKKTVVFNKTIEIKPEEIE